VGVTTVVETIKNRCSTRS